MRRIVPVVLAYAILAAAPDTRCSESPLPLWPLTLETRYLTSNFMEHRSGRFHAGLDLKTAGRSGFPVLAVEDGWISRIRVSSSGYGRTLYLRGNSGRTYVYAHLERFGDRWRDQVHQTQARRGRYDVTLHFPAGKHEVRRGEVMALSGQSGTAGPHLHFEVRDAANRPLDPQAHGFAVPDTIAPSFLKIRVMPASPESRVEGGLEARSVGDGPLTGELPGLRIAGPVAFSAKVLETSDIRGHRLEPCRLAVTLDDSLVFESHNESYDFARQHMMRLEWLEQPDLRERWLFRRLGNDLPGRQGSDWSLDPNVLGPGRHQVKIIAADRAGNTSEVFWTLVVFDQAPGEPPASHSGWDRDPIRVEAEKNDGLVWMTPFLIGRDDEVLAFADGARDVRDLNFGVLTPDSLSAAEIRKAERMQGLVAAGWCARIVAPDWTAAQGVVFPVTAVLPDTLPLDLGLYRHKPRGGWSHIGAPRHLDDGWVFDVTGAGRYALFHDKGAPYLGPGPAEGLVTPAEASAVSAVSAPMWSIVMIRAEDMGAGVDAASVTVRLDGAPLIVEPDPPRDRLLVELPDDTAPGAHHLEISVSDRAGHVTERAYELILLDN